jgi:hypothetical protein
VLRVVHERARQRDLRALALRVALRLAARNRAEPKRWTSVTAPVSPVACVRRALRRMKPEIARYTIPSTRVSGSVASKNRSANGIDKTHWRSGFCGNTSSASTVAVSAIRRAPQLGQSARRLQLNATSYSV